MFQGVACCGEERRGDRDELVSKLRREKKREGCWGVGGIAGDEYRDGWGVLSIGLLLCRRIAVAWTRVGKVGVRC